MDTSRMSAKENKKRKGARDQCRGSIKVKNDEVVVMALTLHSIYNDMLRIILKKKCVISGPLNLGISLALLIRSRQKNACIYFIPVPTLSSYSIRRPRNIYNFSKKRYQVGGISYTEFVCQ